MALPLVPTNTTLRFPPTGVLCYAYIAKTGFNQSRPYDIITNATRAYYRTTDASPTLYDGPSQIGGFGVYGNYRSWGVHDQQYAGTMSGWFRASLTTAQNQALSRLQGRAHDERASLGVMLGETREAHKMMSDRLVQLYRGFSSLKKLRFYDAAIAFRLVRKKRPKKARLGKTGKLYWRKHPRREAWYPAPSRDVQGRSKIKTFAELVLEYNFGWGPLIKDLQSATKVIQRDPYVDRKIRGGGRDRRSTGVIWYYGDGIHNRYESHSLVTRVACGGVYRVSNPNYDLAARLGLVNLFQIGLELVPFSFLLNYVVNLDEWVGNLADDYRASMIGTWTTAKCESQRVHRSVVVATGKTDSYALSEGFTSYRTPGLPGVTLQVRQRFIPSLTRAVNISSLLVALFWGKRV